MPSALNGQITPEERERGEREVGARGREEKGKRGKCMEMVKLNRRRKRMDGFFYFEREIKKIQAAFLSLFTQCGSGCSDRSLLTAESFTNVCVCGSDSIGLRSCCLH